MVGTFIPSDFSAGYSHPLSLIAAKLPHLATLRAETSSKKGMGWQKDRDRKLLKHLEPLEEVPFSWSTGLFGGNERGWRRKRKEQCLPCTQHPLQNSWQGFRQQCTPSPWHGKSSPSPPPSCSLNHGFRLTSGHGTSQSKHHASPTTCCLSSPPLLPASYLRTQRWKQPLAQLSTAPSPFSFGEASIGLSENSVAPLRYSNGDIYPLPNRTIQDVQEDKAHPACFGCSSLALVQG